MSISLRTTIADLKAWRSSFQSRSFHGRKLDIRSEDLVRLVEDAEAAHQLHALVNTPELVDFPRAIHLEAVHQLDKFGSADRHGKKPVDWHWLVAHLAGRSLEHHKEAERLELVVNGLHRADAVLMGMLRDQIAHHREKAVHHTITAAAALNHWHASIVGRPTAMRPGADAPATDFPPLDTTSMEASCQR
jgi:hypothetical protein